MYKQYNMNQLTLPMDIEVLIPTNHLARLIDTAVDKMDPTIFSSFHPGGGRPPYYPKMMCVAHNLKKWESNSKN